VVSDGLGCLRSVKKAGSTHEPVNVTKASDQGEKLVFFRWVNTLLNNLKTVVAGILKLVRRHYVARYLVAFQYRFNDRFDLKSIFRRLAFARTKAARYPTRTFVLCTKQVHQAYMGKAQARTTS
jgi:hypothetical protein